MDGSFRMTLLTYYEEGSIPQSAFWKISPFNHRFHIVLISHWNKCHVAHSLPEFGMKLYKGLSILSIFLLVYHISSAQTKMIDQSKILRILRALYSFRPNSGKEWATLHITTYSMGSLMSELVWLWSGRLCVWH